MRLVNFEGFANIRVYDEFERELVCSAAKSVISANSGKGYVTIHATKPPSVRLRDTRNGMRPASTKPSFGHDLVEAMKLILAHDRCEIELEQVLPKPGTRKSPDKTRTRHAK